MQKVKVVNRVGSKEVVQTRVMVRGDIFAGSEHTLFPGQGITLTLSGPMSLQIRRLRLTGKPKTAWRTVVKAAPARKKTRKKPAKKTVKKKAVKKTAKRKAAKKKKKNPCPGKRANPKKKPTKKRKVVKKAAKKKTAKKRKVVKKKVVKKRKVTKKRK